MRIFDGLGTNDLQECAGPAPDACTKKTTNAVKFTDDSIGLHALSYMPCPAVVGQGGKQRRQSSHICIVVS